MYKVEYKSNDETIWDPVQVLQQLLLMTDQL